jgi:hypothetical protein
MRKASPVWNQPLRQALAVASGFLKYPLFSAQGASVRTISSPAAPRGTSQSFSSTTRSSTPARGCPQEPILVGLRSETSGVDISVML